MIGQIGRRAVQDSENQTERAGWTLGWRFLRMFGIGPSGKPETKADDDGAEELEVTAAIDTLVEELAPEEVDGIPVNIWLFGALSALPVERPLALRLPEGSTAGDVVAELGQRLGEEFLDKVLRSTGEKHSHCRIFIDGEAVEDLGTPLTVNGAPALFEMILLIAAEGG